MSGEAGPGSYGKLTAVEHADGTLVGNHMIAPHGLSRHRLRRNVRSGILADLDPVGLARGQYGVRNRTLPLLRIFPRYASLRLCENMEHRKNFTRLSREFLPGALLHHIGAYVGSSPASALRHSRFGASPLQAPRSESVRISLDTGQSLPPPPPRGRIPRD